MKVTIVLLNWNNYKDTIKCIKSIEKLTVKNYELDIIIVDNASLDNSPQIIKKVFPGLTVISNKENLGFSGGINVGIRHALRVKSDSVFILNNDTLLEMNLIEEIIKTQQRHQADIVSPKIYFTKGYEFHKTKYKNSQLGKVIWYAGGLLDWTNVTGLHIGVDLVDTNHFNKDRKVDYATGAAMYIKNTVFQKIGLFDERYYLYYEDLDFCQRAKLKQQKIYFSSKAIMWHNNAGSSYSGSSLQDYYITRNRLLFGFQYAPLRSKTALVKEAIRLLLKGREWQKKGVIDFFIRNFGKGSYNPSLLKTS